MKKRLMAITLFVICAIALVVWAEDGEEVDPTDRVRLTVWLESVNFTDDGDFWSSGDMFYGSWARFEGTPADQADTNTGGEINVDSGESQGIHDIIFEEETNCPLPDVEVTIQFWECDNSTADKIGKIAEILGDMTPDSTTGKVLTGIGKVIQAITEGGNPSRDDLGTFHELDLEPPCDDCPMETAQTSTHTVNLNGGEGEANGTITLGWKAPKIGTCTDVTDQTCDSTSAYATYDLDDLQHTEMAQNSYDELVLEARVCGEELNTLMEAGHSRIFAFGIDADFNRLTGAPDGSLAGMEWCAAVIQSSDGVQQDVSFAVYYWNGGAWIYIAAIQPHDLVVSENLVKVVINRSDLLIPTPTEISGVTVLYRNGDEVDKAPNNPNIIHRLDWLDDEVAPIPTFYSALPTEISGPVEKITVTFSEQIDTDSLDIQVQPEVPFSYDMDVNTLTITPDDDFDAGSYTVTVNVSDKAGNELDGNWDGTPGDALEFDFLVPDRRFLPTEESGEHKDIFNHDENIYVSGSGFEPGDEVTIYLIRKGSEVDGGPLTDRTITGPTLAQADASGTLPVVNISKTEVMHEDEYSIVADVNGDGLYTEGIDRLWHPLGNGVVVIMEPQQAEPEPTEEPIPL